MTGEDLAALRDYRRRRTLMLGLASNHDDPRLVDDHLKEARALGVSFFNSLHAPDCVRSRYRAFESAGFPMTSCDPRSLRLLCREHQTIPPRPTIDLPWRLNRF